MAATWIDDNLLLMWICFIVGWSSIKLTFNIESNGLSICSNFNKVLYSVIDGMYSGPSILAKIVIKYSFSWSMLNVVYLKDNGLGNSSVSNLFRIRE